MSDKIKTLSEAIRYGSTFLGETHHFFSDRNEFGEYTCGCALGTAFLAVIDREHQYPVREEQIFNPLSEKFGVPVAVLQEVSWQHYHDKMNRAQCADWLESKGY